MHPLRKYDSLSRISVPVQPMEAIPPLRRPVGTAGRAELPVGVVVVISDSCIKVGTSCKHIVTMTAEADGSSRSELKTAEFIRQHYSDFMTRKQLAHFAPDRPLVRRTTSASDMLKHGER